MLLSRCQAVAINVNEKCCCPYLLASNLKFPCHFFITKAFFIIIFLLMLRHSLLLGKFVSAPGKCIPRNCKRLCMCLHALQQLLALLCCIFRVQHKLTAAAGSKSLPLFSLCFCNFSPLKVVSFFKFSTFLLKFVTFAHITKFYGLSHLLLLLLLFACWSLLAS